RGRADRARQARRRAAPTRARAHGRVPVPARAARLLSPRRAQAVATPLAYPGTVNVLAAILVASASLHITVWPNGRGHAPKRTYTLTCAPVGGTPPPRAPARARLAPLKAPFAPTPRNVA